MYFVYFARSLMNGKIYVGSTSVKPEKRIEQHNSSSNKYTKGIAPLTLIYFEEYTCKEDARKREMFYKSGFGKQIKTLIVKYLQNWAGSSVG